MTPLDCDYPEDQPAPVQLACDADDDHVNNPGYSGIVVKRDGGKKIYPKGDPESTGTGSTYCYLVDPAKDYKERSNGRAEAFVEFGFVAASTVAPTKYPTAAPTQYPTVKPTPRPTDRGDECSTSVDCIAFLEGKGRDIDCPACENGHCVSKPTNGCSDEEGCCNLSGDRAKCSDECDGAEFCFQRGGDYVDHCSDPTCSLDGSGGLPECGV